jgi:hypothetical protein
VNDTRRAKRALEAMPAAPEPAAPPEAGSDPELEEEPPPLPMARATSGLAAAAQALRGLAASKAVPAPWSWIRRRASAQSARL